MTRSPARRTIVTYPFRRVLFEKLGLNLHHCHHAAALGAFVAPAERLPILRAE